MGPTDCFATVLCAEANADLQKQVERLSIEAATLRQVHEADMEAAARLRSEADTR